MNARAHLREQVRSLGYELSIHLCGDPVRETGGEGIFRAPYRNDSSPSLRVVRDKPGKNPGDWTDDPTGEGGDVFALYAKVHNLDASRDFSRILTDSAVLLGIREDAPPKSQSRTEFAPEPTWSDFAARYGLPEDAWSRAGFAVVPGKGGRHVIRYPITRPNNAINGHKVRTVARDASGKRKAWADPAGLGSDGLVIPLSSPPIKGGRLILCGGEEKALASVHAGFASASMPFGEKIRLPTVAMIAALEPSEVVVAFDAEEPNAEPAAQALADAGLRVSVCVWPDCPKGRDLNDDLREGGAQAVKDRIDAAEAVAAPVIEPPAKLDHEFLEILAPPPFPLHALPPVVSEMVENVSWIAGMDDRGMAALFSLAAISAALTGKVSVNMGAFVEPANIYALAVAEPSERKSTIQKPFFAPMQLAQSRANAELKAKSAEIEAEKMGLEEEIKAIKKRFAKGASANDKSKLNDLLTQRDELEARTKSPFTISGDATMESLANEMSKNQGAWSVVSTEAGIFDVIQGNRYSKSQTANLDLMLQAFSGDLVSISRVHAGRTVIEHPALTVCLAAQHAVLKRIKRDSEALSGRGFLARFLYWVVPYRKRAETYNRAPSESAIRAWESMILKLLEIPIPADAKDRRVRLSDAARDIWRKADRHHEEMTRGGGLGSVERFLADWRHPGMCLRIAALLHFAEHAHSPLWRGLHGAFGIEIHSDTMSAAVEIVDTLRLHAKAAYRMMGLRSDAGDPQADALAVLDTIRLLRADGVSVTRTHLLRRTKWSSDRLGAAFGELLSSGLIRPGADKTIEVAEELQV